MSTGIPRPRRAKSPSVFISAKKGGVVGLIKCELRRHAASSPSSAPMAPNDRWSLDFRSYQLTCGRRFRIITVVNDHGDRTYFETVRLGIAVRQKVCGTADNG
jgi:hypothetical protein